MSIEPPKPVDRLLRESIERYLRVQAALKRSDSEPPVEPPDQPGSESPPGPSR